MNSKISALFAFTIIFSLVALVPASIFAQGAPCIPNRFYGDALANGKPAPTGLTVTVQVNGVETSSVITVDGKYGYTPHIFNVLDNDNDCENGGTVEFFIGGQPAGQATYNNGYFTLLDISANNVNIPQPPPTNNGGGDTSGGSGGSFTPPACTPDWSCSDWSQCVDSSQDRECLDLNICDTDSGKPTENQVCGIESVLPENCTQGETTCVGDTVWECEAENSWQRSDTCENECSAGTCVEASEPTSGEEEIGVEEGSPITGLDIFEPSNLPYWLIIIVIILIALYLLFGRRGKKKK